ncbi:MAG: tol-pal system-associated acyl-CoA thioesterase [Bdellovibrionales bacterium]
MTTKPDPKAPHHLPVRIYYEDTDAGGVVYYANYLKFAERGRMEFLRRFGYSHEQVREEHDSILVVRHVEVDYLASARLDELLDVVTEATECKNSSMTMKQTVCRGDTVLAEITVVIVAVGKSGRAVRIPPQLRQIFGS